MELFIIIGAVVFFLAMFQKIRAEGDIEFDNLRKEKGILGRYSLVFEKMQYFAPDCRVLRNQLSFVEAVGTMNGAKTYLAVRHYLIVGVPLIVFRVSVVKTNSTQTRYRLFREPITPQVLWSEIEIQAEKLADNLYF